VTPPEPVVFGRCPVQLVDGYDEAQVAVLLDFIDRSTRILAEETDHIVGAGPQ
jgi:hypothetical protein